MIDFLADHIGGIGDTISLTIVVGALTQYLPAVAAGLSILWTSIRLIEWANERFK